MAGPEDIILRILTDLVKATSDITEFTATAEEEFKDLDDAIAATKIDEQFASLTPVLERLRKQLKQVKVGSKGFGDEIKKTLTQVIVEFKQLGIVSQESGKKVASSGDRAKESVKKLSTSLARAVEEYRHLSRQKGFDKQSADAKKAAESVRSFAEALQRSSRSVTSLKQVNRAFELIDVSAKDVRNKLGLLTEAFKKLQSQPGFDRTSAQADILAQKIEKAANELKEFSSQASDVRAANNAFKLLTKSTKELRDDVDKAKSALMKLWAQPGFKKSSKEAIEAEKNFKKAAAALLKVSHSAADLKRVSLGMQKVNKSAKRLHTGFRKLQSVAAGFGVTLGAIGLIRFVKSAVTAKIAMERIEQSLIAATGSTEGAERAFKFIDETVIELGLDLNTSAQSFSQLAAAAKGTSLEGIQLEKVFHAVAVSGRVLNLGVDQIKGTIVALRQMIGKARVSAEELRRQLGDRIPGAFELAARAMGVTTRELDKMMERGELLAVDLLPRLADEMLDTFGPGLGKALDSTAAKLGRLNTEWFKTKAAFGEGFAEGFGESLEETGEGLAGIREGARAAGGGLGWLADKLALVASGTRTLNIARKQALITQGLAIAEAEEDAEAIERLTREYDELEEQIRSIAAAQSDTSAASDRLVEDLLAQATAVARNVERLRELGDAAPNEEIDAITRGLHQLVSQFGRLEDSAKSPALRTMAELAKQAANEFEGTAQYVEVLINNIQKALETLDEGGTLTTEQAKNTVAAIQQIIAKWSQLPEAQKAALKDTIEGLKSYRLDALEQLKGFDEVLKEFGFKTRDEIEASIGALSRFIEETKSLEDPTTAVADSVVKKYEEIAESIATLPREQQVAALELLAQLGDVEGEYTKFTTKFAKDSEKAAKKAKKAWDGFADGLLDLFEIVSEEAEATGERIRKSLSPPGEIDDLEGPEGKNIEELTEAMAGLQAEKQKLENTPILSAEEVNRMGELNGLIADYRQEIRGADPMPLPQLDEYREAVRELTVENEGFREVFLAAGEDSQNEIQGIIENFESLIETENVGVDAAKDFGRTMSRALEKVKGVPEDIVKQFDSLGKGVRDVSDIFNDLRKGAEGSASGMEKLAESAKTTEDTMQQIARKTKEFAKEAKEAGEEAALGFEALNVAIGSTEQRLSQAVALCKELKECMSNGA